MKAAITRTGHFCANWSGGRNKRASVGTERNDNGADDANLYQTPWVATECLIRLVPDLGPHVVDPACGPGAILMIFEAHDFIVSGFDLHDYSVNEDGEINPFWEAHKPELGDFLERNKLPSKARKRAKSIVANPPYNAADAFVAHALAVARKNGMRHVCMLLRLNFLAGCGEPRCASLDEIAPHRTLIFSRRLPMMHREDFEGKKSTSTMDMVWLVFDLEAAPEDCRTWERVDWAAELDLSAEQGEGGECWGRPR